VDTRWLDTDEQQIWLAVAYTLARLPAALDADLERAAGINMFEYLVLCGLSMAPDRTLRLSELAEFTASSLSRLSNVVTRLEKRGWLRRGADPADGRCTLATLTETGWDKLTDSAPSHVESVRRLAFDPLTGEQQRQFGEIGRRILRAINPAGHPTP
jgi:DNA-binding MarR family transcriptional regulator